MTMTRIVDTCIVLGLLTPMVGSVAGLLYAAYAGESPLVAAAFVPLSMVASLVPFGVAALCSLWAD